MPSTGPLEARQQCLSRACAVFAARRRWDRVTRMHKWMLAGLAGIALYTIVAPWRRAAEGAAPAALTLAVTRVDAPSAAGAMSPFLRAAPDGSVLMS